MSSPIAKESHVEESCTVLSGVVGNDIVVMSDMVFGEAVVILEAVVVIPGNVTALV